jgi:hypothetical protein
MGDDEAAFLTNADEESFTLRKRKGLGNLSLTERLDH